MKLPLFGRVVELPPALLEEAGVTNFRKYLVRTGMSEENAGRQVEVLVGVLLVDSAAWLGKEMGRHLQTVERLRTELRTRYGRVLRVMRENPGIAELPHELQPEAFHALFAEMTQHMDDLAAPGDALNQRMVPLQESTGRENGTGPAEPPAGRFRRSGDAQAENAYMRELRRLSDDFDDRPKGERGGRPAAPRRAVAERAAEILADHLGLDRKSVTVGDQPMTGPHLAAWTDLGVFDPVRELGFEMFFKVTSEVPGSTDRVQVKPDALRFRDARAFDLLEFKSHERVPGKGFFARSARAEVADMEVRARLAESLPGCEGWRYRTALPEMREVYDWAFKTLRGEGRTAGAPPEAASPEFVREVQTRAALGNTGWARKLGVD